MNPSVSYLPCKDKRRMFIFCWSSVEQREDDKKTIHANIKKMADKISQEPETMTVHTIGKQNQAIVGISFFKFYWFRIYMIYMKYKIVIAFSLLLLGVAGG